LDTHRFEPGACDRVRKLVGPHVSNELPARAVGTLLEHTALCAPCARALEDGVRLKAMVKSAAGAAEAPPELRNRIRARIRAEAPTALLSTAWKPLAAAAAFVLVFAGAWVAVWQSGGGPAGAEPSVARGKAEDDASFLEVGSTQHDRCTNALPPPEVPIELEQMEAQLGPEYANLAPLVRGRIPGDLSLVDAHVCSSDNRDFAHLVLRRGESLVSVLVTERGGAALPRDVAPARLDGSDLRVFRHRGGDVEASGFATLENVVSVVSGAVGIDTSEIVSAVGPAVRDYLGSSRE
jgi:hypothetical protein